MNDKTRGQKIMASIHGVLLEKKHGIIILDVAKAKGMSESDLATRLNMPHQSMISRKLNGINKISVGHLRQIYELLEEHPDLYFLPDYIDKKIGIKSIGSTDPIVRAYDYLIEGYNARIKILFLEGTIETRFRIAADLEELVKKYSPPISP